MALILTKSNDNCQACKPCLICKRKCCEHLKCWLSNSQKKSNCSLLQSPTTKPAQSLGHCLPCSPRQRNLLQTHHSTASRPPSENSDSTVASAPCQPAQQPSPVSKVSPYKKSIPAKPPFTPHCYCHPAPIRTKDRMRPP